MYLPGCAQRRWSFFIRKAGVPPAPEFFQAGGSRRTGGGVGVKDGGSSDDGGEGAGGMIGAVWAVVALRCAVLRYAVLWCAGCG